MKYFDSYNLKCFVLQNLASTSNFYMLKSFVSHNLLKSLHGIDSLFLFIVEVERFVLYGVGRHL